MAYIVTSDVKLYGGWTTTDVGDDALIQVLIPIAQQLVDTFTNRTFEVSSDEDAIRYYDADEDIRGDYTLMLDRDLNTIESVKCETITISSNNYVTEPKSDAPYWGITLLANSSDSWSYVSDSENAIAVNGQWAYSSDAPADIQMATILTVQWLRKMRNSDLALTAPIIDAASGITIMPIQLPNIVKSILARYRRATFEVV